MCEHDKTEDARRRHEAWCTHASHCIADTYHLCMSFIAEQKSMHPFVRFVSTQVLISCHLTSESVLLLVLHQKLWDADALMRSVLEGTVKYAFLLDGEESQRLEKAEEYWNTLPEMARLSRHRRASRWLATFGGMEAEMARPIAELALSPEEVERLRAKYPKRKRKTLEQKWSFTEMVRYFAEHKNPRYHDMAVLAHAYGMQSHVVHQDGDGVSLVWDRYQRSPARRTAIEIAHAGKIVADTCSLGFLRGCHLASALCQPTDPVMSAVQKYQALFDDIAEAGKHWYGIEYASGAEGYDGER